MWSFTEYGTQETIAQSKLDQFFTANGGAGEVVSLIRESLQNALDAKSSKTTEPVKVKLTLGSLSSAGDILINFNEHVSAVIEQRNVRFPKKMPNSYPFILIEDFNTTGFGGCFDKNDENNKDSLVKFWWEEGISEKRKGGGGSHGVGKVTLSSASKSRLFFAYSFREEDDDELFFGYCRIGNHNFEKKKLREYARFGNTVDNGQLYPYSNERGDSQKIKQFKELLSLYKRSTHGSSIFIPNINTGDINYPKVLNVVVRNFYLPIMKGLLEIEIISEEMEIALDKLNFIQEANKLDLPDMKSKLQLAEFIVSDSPAFNLSSEFKFSIENKHIEEESFSPERFEELQKEYSECRPIKLKLNIELEPCGDEHPQNGFFNIALQKINNSNEDDNKKPFYEVFRGEIRVKDEKHKSNKASAILDIFASDSNDNGNPLSEFFKYCEDPGHTNWNARINRQNESKKYKQDWPKQTIRFLVDRLINLLEGNKEKEITNFADDIFTIPKKLKEEVGFDDNDDGDSHLFPTFESLPPLFSIDKLEGGFRIKPTKYMNSIDLQDNEYHVDVTLSYEILGASKLAWKKSGRFDIDLTDEKYALKSEEIELTNVEKNTFVFSLTNSFEIRATGFDINKNLYIEIADRKLKTQLIVEKNI